MAQQPQRPRLVYRHSEYDPDFDNRLHQLARAVRDSPSPGNLLDLRQHMAHTERFAPGVREFYQRTHDAILSGESLAWEYE